MEIDPPPGLTAFVEEKVVAGLYASPTEVICDALRGFRERDAAWRAHMAAEIDKGWRSAERGELVDADEVLAELDRDMAEVEAGKLVKA